MELALINLIPFALAAALTLPGFRQTLQRTGVTWLMGGAMALMFVWALSFLPTVTDQGYIQQAWEWVPDLGLTLSWYLDGLSLIFVLVVTGIGTAVFLYAGYYFEDAEEQARFFSILSTFAGAMLALVTAGNIITLFIAWELTSITSYLLIGFKGNKSEDARIGASRALVITGGGGLALLVGLLLMGTAVGSFEMIDILKADTLTEHPWYNAITIAIMLGCFTKSAQFPFHFWLPGAMSAPSPASAYLHSATMVKAGVYLLFRFYPPLGNTDLWQNSLLVIGLTTMLVGALFAIRQRDMKGLLAYTTISKLGSMVALISLPESAGLKAALIGILAHAMYKGTLFLLAGVIEHATGTRNLDNLGGLRKYMPGVAIISATVAISMAGFPPLFGFVAKETLIDAFLHEQAIVGLIPTAVVFISSVLMVMSAGLVFWDVFISKPETEYHHFHAPPLGLSLGPALLAVMSLVSGLFLTQIIEPVVDPALKKEIHLYLFPPDGLENQAFQLSLAILVIGPLLFLVRRIWLTMPWFRLPTGTQIYAGSIRTVEWTGDLLLRSQAGKVRYYLASILGVISILMFLGGFDNLRGLNITFDYPSTDILNFMMLIMTVGATLAATLLRKHLLAALAMGVSGYAVGGIILLQPSPDVALVQFLVETLATVLIILMIARISPEQREQAMRVLWIGSREGRFGLLRDTAISLVIGISVGLFALAAVNDREQRLNNVMLSQLRVGISSDDLLNGGSLFVSDWYLNNAYEEIGVPDVVSAIVTDFRGTDTFIEITVFAMASLGVLTLLTLPEGGELLTGPRVTGVMRALARRPDDDDDVSPTYARVVETIEKNQSAEGLNRAEYSAFSEEHDIPHLSTPLTKAVAQMVFPFAMLVAFSHVLYGGSGPGDGFTAGVVAGLAVALWYVVFGYFETRARLHWLHPGRLISIGLTIALVNAVAGIVFEDAFLRLIEFGDGKGPAGIHLSTTLFFEVAIFLTVFGGVTTIMEAIAHPKDVEQEV